MANPKDGMYAEAFADFIRVETWHTSHKLDQQRFYRALARVVTRPDFNPSEMADHFRQIRGAEFTEERLYEIVSRYESAADVIQGYLGANGMVDA